MRFFKKKRKWNNEIDPDEIFMDAKNLPSFNTQQFEDVIERSITKRSLRIVAVLFILCGLAFVIRVGSLQIVQGGAFYSESENNRLHKNIIFSERGVISDRNGEDVVWNAEIAKEDPFAKRVYTARKGHSHILGYVGYPKADTNNNFWRDSIIGRAGIEMLRDDFLQGVGGNEIVETDVRQEIQSRTIVDPPIDGENITLAIDARIQEQLFLSIEEMTQQFGYEAGAGVIMDVETGGLVALVSVPEYESSVITQGVDTHAIEAYFNDTSKPFLNRAISGLYTPGSIVKPFVAIAALEEGVITKDTKILSTGEFVVPNPFDPENPSIFKDWREEGHGVTDVYHAIADSVNTYFYVVSGGDARRDGLGIKKMESYMKLFDLGGMTGIDLEGDTEGVIPNPAWKESIFDDAWRLGDTYITSIGQFGFQVTPLQMARAFGALANGGTLVTPHVIIDEGISNKRYPNAKRAIDQQHFDTIRQAMRQTVTGGTAGSLRVPYVEVAAKTGTAQVSNRTKVNSWVAGFYPYDVPQYSFAIVMEKGPNEEPVSATWAMRRLLDWVSLYAPDHFEESGAPVVEHDI